MQTSLPDLDSWPILKITYYVVESDDKQKFEMQVNQYINEGWKPLGGVAIVAFGDKTIHREQAMVKYG